MIAIVFGIYLLLLILVNFGPSQQWLTDVVEDALEEKLNTDISIEKVEVGLFNRLTLHHVVVKDQRGVNLLQSELLSAKIELAPLLKGMVSLRTVSALDSDVKLYVSNFGEKPNFQFLIDAFSSKNPEKNSHLNLRVNSLIFRRCNFSYDEKYKPETPGCLNLSHLDVNDLDANISLKSLTPDSLNLRVRSLKLKEKSGLDIQSLSLRMSANKRHCDISHFEMRLPNSRIAKESLQADYVLNAASDFVSTLDVNGSLSDATIATDDVAFLAPQIKNLNQVVHLSSEFNVRPDQIHLNRLKLKEERNQLRLNASVLMNREKGEVKRVRATVKHLFVDQDAVIKIVEGVTGSKSPAPVARLGNVHFDGRVDYKKEDWSLLKGKLSSAQGELITDLEWKGKAVKGKADVQLISVNDLLGRTDLPEQIVVGLDGKANFNQKERPEVHIRAHFDELGYKACTYRDVVLTGGLNGQQVNVQFESPHPSADLALNFDAQLVHKNLQNLKLDGDIRYLHPGKLNLTSYFGNYAISSKIKASCEKIDLNQPVGNIRVQNFHLLGEDPYHLEQLNLLARNSTNGTLLRMQSDFGSFKLDGPLSLPRFTSMLSHLIGTHIPGLAGTEEKELDDKWRFNIKLAKSDFFNKVLHLPLRFDDGFEAEGYFDGTGHKVFLSAVANDLAFKATEIADLRVLVRNHRDELLSRVQLNKKMGQENIHFELENATEKGRLLTDFMWSDFKKGSYKGFFKTSTQIDSDKTVCTNILPTTITIRDTVWNVLPGEVRMLKDSVDIQSIEVQHGDQGIRLYGKLSKNPADSLIVDLSEIDLDYILSMVNLGSFSFGGLASGKIALTNTLDSLQLRAKLSVPDFRFNDGLMGYADIYGDWNISDRRLNLLGDIREKNWGFTKVSGYVGLAEKKLDLRIDSKNTNVYCLNRYVGGIFNDLEGRATGYCRVYGPFGGIDFEGDEEATLSAEIDATGVRYEVSGGRVVMSPGRFGFQNMNVFDNLEGRGKLNGELLHRHLKNIRYNMNVDTDHLLVYDKPQSVDMPFYATTYGTGNIKLKGSPGKMEADINMRPEKNTTFVYTVDMPEGVGDVQLLKFADASDTIRNTQELPGETQKTPQNTSSTDILLRFLVDMNPEATLKVIMDRRTGDHLIVHGYGPIRASFYNKGDFQMFGKLNVDRGTYKMSIQDVIRKDFEFTKGSYINFTGDPFEGDLGLRALYTVNSASLSDLNIGNNLSDNSVRVNCVLNFSGKVKSPQVSFDLELPSVSEDVQQMVRNLISSEEDMNMQILYLLGVGRFYTYNYSSTASAESQSQSAVAVKSFLSNTLSSQLNNIISNAVGSSNWSFGANLSTGNVGWSDMEVEGILSGRLLNNRLLINGNFGYRDRPTYSSTANFVGDFDVRYLLTPGGGISLKAYSETNDRYFSKSSLSTQGIGLQLKRDFTNLRDLFMPRKKKNAQKE